MLYKLCRCELLVPTLTPLLLNTEEGSALPLPALLLVMSLNSDTAVPRANLLHEEPPLPPPLLGSLVTAVGLLTVLLLLPQYLPKEDGELKVLVVVWGLTCSSYDCSFSYKRQGHTYNTLPYNIT